MTITYGQAIIALGCLIVILGTIEGLRVYMWGDSIPPSDPEIQKHRQASRDAIARYNARAKALRDKADEYA